MFFKILIIFNLATVILSDSYWDYFKNGPDAWGLNYKECNGFEQSPINIISDETVYSPELTRIKFIDYEMLNSWNITNSDKSGKNNKTLNNIIK
jgi:carbonic anhydrase